MGDQARDRRQLAAYLRGHGPTHGDKLAVALGVSLEEFWVLIDHGWFDIVKGGWGLSARGEREWAGPAGGE
jgi:hypothetical protein